MVCALRAGLFCVLRACPCLPVTAAPTVDFGQGSHVSQLLQAPAASPELESLGLANRPGADGPVCLLTPGGEQLEKRREQMRRAESVGNQAWGCSHFSTGTQQELGYPKSLHFPLGP